MQSNLWIICAVMAALAVLSGFAEHRRRGRVNMDKVGWVPWPTIQFLALMGALLAGAVALHA